MDEAEDLARLHLAQVVWDGQETESPVITNSFIQADFRSWAEFQKRYRRWKETGADDQIAHQQAGMGIEPVPV